MDESFITYNYTQKEKALKEVEAYTKEIESKARYRLAMEELGIEVM